MGGIELQPLIIGRHRIWPPLLLAPMAGCTDSVLRLLCKRQEAGLVCTELTSSHGLYQKNPKSFEFLRWTDEERPVSAQIFGAEPAIMATAARIVTEAGADIIDINMGCWVPKVARTGAGACLLKDMKRAAAVMEAVVRATPLPVTVKTRVGWDGCTGSAVELAGVAEACGVRAVAIHGRTAQQGFTGNADWTPIGEARAAVQIPVIGNGDVRTPADALRLLRTTGCHAVMVGRAALGNPWIFRELAAYLLRGETLSGPADGERIDMAWQHALLLARDFNRADVDLDAPLPACARGQLGHYFHGLPNASLARAAIGQVRRLADVRRIIDDAREALTAAHAFLAAGRGLERRLLACDGLTAG
jgi:tRNA-dihydrouridine synthase B